MQACTCSHRLSVLIVILCIIQTTPLSAQVTQDWVARTDSIGSRGVAVDQHSNVYVIGNVFRGTSGMNMVLVKYNPGGNQQWMREYNGTGDDLDDPTAVALDTSGNVFVTGYSFRGPGTEDFEIVTIKYAPNGDTLWVRRYNGLTSRDDRSFAIVTDVAGNAYVAGFINGILVSGGTGRDFITIKYSSDGSQLWSSQLGLAYCSETRGLAVGSDGSVYVAGSGGYSSSTSSEYLAVKYNGNGDSLWVKRYDGNVSESDEAQGLALDDGGNVYVTGRSTGPASYDYVTIKYDPTGQQQWVRRYNGPGDADDTPTGLVVDANQNIYVTGKSTVSGSFILTDFVTIKYTSAGDSLWLKRYNGPGNSEDIPADIAIDSTGSVYITGPSIGTGFSGYHDYATIKYGTNGDSLWLQRYNPGDLEDAPTAIVLDLPGNVYVTGFSVESFTAEGSATIKYSQTPPPFAQSTAVPPLGNGSTTAFGNTHITFIGDVTVSDSVTVFYYLGAPTPGTLPSGIIDMGRYYWRILNSGTIFTNGYMRIATQDLFGVTAGGCGACLVWLRRSNPGDPWENLGGVFTGTLTNGTLTSSVPFGSFSEFAIGSSDSTTLPVRESVTPLTFALAQNYPNPFNPTTTIRYQLPAAGFVSLKVYSLLGSEVAAPVNGMQDAGTYMLHLDGTGLASGVYFYQLRSAGGAETKQMILLK